MSAGGHVAGVSGRTGRQNRWQSAPLTLPHPAPPPSHHTHWTREQRRSEWTTERTAVSTPNPAPPHPTPPHPAPFTPHPLDNRTEAVRAISQIPSPHPTPTPTPSPPHPLDDRTDGGQGVRAISQPAPQPTHPDPQTHPHPTTPTVHGVFKKISFSTIKLCDGVVINFLITRLRIKL